MNSSSDKPGLPIQPITRDRPRIVPGIVFAVETRGNHFVFGRVVKEFHLMGGRVRIVYIYRHVGDSIEDTPPSMGLDDLLIDPCLVAGDLWGSFLKVGFLPLAEGEIRDVEYYFGGDEPNPPLKLDNDGRPIPPEIDKPRPWALLPKSALLDAIEAATGDPNI